MNSNSESEHLRKYHESQKKDRTEKRKRNILIFFLILLFSGGGGLFIKSEPESDLQQLLAGGVIFSGVLIVAWFLFNFGFNKTFFTPYWNENFKVHDNDSPHFLLISNSVELETGLNLFPSPLIKKERISFWLEKKQKFEGDLLFVKSLLASCTASLFPFSMSMIILFAIEKNWIILSIQALFLVVLFSAIKFLLDIMKPISTSVETLKFYLDHVAPKLVLNEDLAWK